MDCCAVWYVCTQCHVTRCIVCRTPESSIVERLGKQAVCDPTDFNPPTSFPDVLYTEAGNHAMPQRVDSRLQRHHLTVIFPSFVVRRVHRQIAAINLVAHPVSSAIIMSHPAILRQIYASCQISARKRAQQTAPILMADTDACANTAQRLKLLTGP
jgi:hypothetical protein